MVRILVTKKRSPDIFKNTLNRLSFFFSSCYVGITEGLLERQNLAFIIRSSDVKILT